MANEIEGIEILADIFNQRIKRQTFVIQLVDDGLFTVCSIPVIKEILEAGKPFLQSFLSKTP